MFVTKKYNLRRDEEDEKKARRCSHSATLSTFCKIWRSRRPEYVFAV